MLKVISYVFHEQPLAHYCSFAIACFCFLGCPFSPCCLTLPDEPKRNVKIFSGDLLNK